MAATISSSPWGNKPSVIAGSWALDSEQNETEQQKNDKKQDDNGPADFPSLSAAVTTKPKKKKGQKLSLAEFSTFTAPSKASTTFQPSFLAKGLTHEDLLALPTGPRQRTAEELEGSKLGGGFRSFGGGSGRGRYSEGEDSNSRWGSGSGSRPGSSDGTRRDSNSRWGSGSRPGSSDGTRRDSSNEFMPSRADEVDDWTAGKKSTVGNGFDRRERGAGAAGGGGGLSDKHSKADESDNWGSNRSFAPTEPRRYVGTRGGGGFERDRRGSGGFESIGGVADSESWKKNIDERISSPVNGSGSGSRRPKLNLQPRTLPVVAANAVQQQQQTPLGIIPRAKGYSNPFGEARPREEVLEEKGQDWKKIDEQLESIKIKEIASRAGTVANAHRNRRGSSPEDRVVERSWRKNDSVDAPRPRSAEKVENEVEEET